MTADPDITRRTILKEQSSQIQISYRAERARHGQATAALEFNQHGRLPDGETLSRLANHPKSYSNNVLRR